MFKFKQTLLFLHLTKKSLMLKNCNKRFCRNILKICWRRFDIWLMSLSSQSERLKMFTPLCDLCDSDDIGFTAQHLHQHIVEHKNSAIGNLFLTAHRDTNHLKETQFCILKVSRKNMTVLSMRCFSSSSAILVSTCRLIPFVQNSLFKRMFHYLLSF